MSDVENGAVQGDTELDNPLRAIIVHQPEGSTSGEMEERLLDNVQSFDDMNEFFDSFDETIAIPNENHIKYEVGSDGLVVVIVDTKELLDKTLKFFDDYADKDSKQADNKEDSEEENDSKRRKN